MRLPPLLKGKTSEIRGSFWYKLLGRAIGMLLWILGSTWKYKFTFYFDRRELGCPCIFALWHNRIFSAPNVWMQLDTGQDMGFLTSASKDGSLVAEALAVFGLKSVRGSSSRRGVAALMKMRKLLTQGSCVTITPDGPKGPRYQIKEGLLRLAQISGYPILPMAVEYSNCWRFNTWDKMSLPKPFSKVEFHFHKPLFIPQDLTDGDFSSYAEILEQTMKKGLPDFEPFNPADQ